MASTYNDLFLDARKILKKIDVSAADLEAREILACAADKTREELSLDMQKYAPDYVKKALEELLERRIQGEPIAYVIGEWDFYGMTLKVTPDVLIPRPDTELLVERALACMNEQEKPVRILDLCTGSGCVGLAILKNRGNSRAVLIDNSQSAIQVCKDNVRSLHLQAVATVLQEDVCESPNILLGQFDVITCNPPYIPVEDIETLDSSVKEYEPFTALDGGVDGLDFYRTIAKLWKPTLNSNGTILFEIGVGQADDVKAILEQEGYHCIAIYPDYAGILRVVEAKV